MKIMATSDINSVAKGLYFYVEGIENSINTIESYLDIVPTFWIGTDADHFLSKYRNEVIPELREYVKVLRAYQKFLAEVYPIFQALDEHYDKQIPV